MGAEVVISVHLEPGLLDGKPRNTIEVISRSFSIYSSGRVCSVGERRTNVLIEPDVHQILCDEFVNTPQLVAAGEAAAYAALPATSKIAIEGRIERRVTERRRSSARPQPRHLS